MSEFRDRVYELVGRIPEGRLMTYGQVAALCGSPRAALIVGQIAHFGPENLPWQRVVMKSGGLARGFPDGLVGHKNALVAEGVFVTDDFMVDVEKLMWWPLM
ncbi:MGMT family protein [Candidatus Saccharibacteria bacterium]|jgi:methylated-DNA-protein-cysteine methyltransferase-like protein|nr:MGMT family protein [Candidatus Saccharibacteria bacterium]